MTYSCSSDKPLRRQLLQQRRTAAAALVKDEIGRRQSGAPVRRSGHRQVSSDCRAARTSRQRTAHAVTLFLLTAAHRQRIPIIGQMERAAGFTHADTAQVKLDKLNAVLALASTSKQDAALFAEMLSLPNDGR